MTNGTRAFIAIWPSNATVPQNQMTQVPLCRCFFLLSYKFKNLSFISFQGTCKRSILKLKLIFLEDTLCLLPLNYTFSQILWTWRDSLSFRYSVISTSSQDWGKNPLLCSHFIFTFSPKQISVAEIPKLTVTPLLKISLKIWSQVINVLFYVIPAVTDWRHL